MSQIILPERIRQYLNKRHISDEIIAKTQLNWNDHDIVIPVFDSEGKHLFNKYRRDPAIHYGPKYKYDSGASVALYNVNALPEDTDQMVFITEGELDTLVLCSLGYSAISSTGGAGSFSPEWVQTLKAYNSVYICYDSDIPGINGAINLQSFLPKAKILWLPRHTKDITDYFFSFTHEDFIKLVQEAESYFIPINPDHDPTTKKGYKDLIRDYGSLWQVYLEKQRALKFKKKEWQFTEAIMEYLDKRKMYYEQRLDRIQRFDSVSTESDEIQKAKKAQPISNFIKFNRSGFAKCPWHEDGSPSLKYYHLDNRVYCYGGCGNKDLIDVVMALERVDFTSAVKKLNNNG